MDNLWFLLRDWQQKYQFQGGGGSPPHPPKKVIINVSGKTEKGKYYNFEIIPHYLLLHIL
jgi:hypothetical protein